MIKILGIDTSCDDTCASVLTDNCVLSSMAASQIKLHQPYGGVFPTVAKLAHQQNLPATCETALKRAGVTIADLAAVAVTAGPGLAPALEVGITFAKNFATTHHLPLLAINHLEGHLLSPLLNNRHHLPNHPEPTNCLGLVISGGHTQLMRLEKIGKYQLLGETLDDAIGECLDKIGRLLSLGYPAGPAIELLAREGNSNAYHFPLPLTSRQDYDLSFSGLKTFAKNLIDSLKQQYPNGLSKTQLQDLAASCQQGVFAHLLYKVKKLLTKEDLGKTIFVGGGVAANIYGRGQLRSLSKQFGKTPIYPYHRRFCGDNAAMIALVAYYQLQAGLCPQRLASIERQPNWQLTSWN